MTQEPARLAVVVLVDLRGWLLLQERDEHAPVAPDKWGLVGGHVNPGEDFESAVYRELAEETGLAWHSGLEPWFDGVPPVASPAERGHHRVWVGAADLTDADIVVGEGRQIVFVDPARLGELDLSQAAAYLLPRLLESPLYARLR